MPTRRVTPITRQSSPAVADPVRRSSPSTATRAAVTVDRARNPRPSGVTLPSMISRRSSPSPKPALRTSVAGAGSNPLEASQVSSSWLDDASGDHPASATTPASGAWMAPPLSSSSTSAAASGLPALRRSRPTSMPLNGLLASTSFSGSCK